MASNSHAVIEFSQLEPFLAELNVRGPNVEPLVRMGIHFRQARGTVNGKDETVFPYRHVYVCASYLRQVGEVLLVAKLQTYVGDEWPGPLPENDRTDERRQAALVQLEAAVAAKGLELVDGSSYT